MLARTSAFLRRRALSRPLSASVSFSPPIPTDRTNTRNFFAASRAMSSFVQVGFLLGYSSNPLLIDAAYAGTAQVSIFLARLTPPTYPPSTTLSRLLV